MAAWSCIPVLAGAVSTKHQRCEGRAISKPSLAEARCMAHIDSHESKPAMCILSIIEENQKNSIISYFATYSFYEQT